MTRASDLAKLLGAGATINDGTTITTDDNTAQLILQSTDADASSGPQLTLKRDSSSPADDDFVGRVKYIAENDASQEVTYVDLLSRIKDASDGTEDGEFQIKTMVAGSDLTNFKITSSGVTNGQPEVVINDDSVDMDFRVESNGQANMLFVDGGNDKIGIGLNSPGTSLHIRSSVASNIAGYRDGTTGLIVEGDAASYIQLVASKTNPMAILFDGGDTHNDTARGGLIYDIDTGLSIKSGGATRWTINETGNFVPSATSLGVYLGVTSATSSNLLNDYEEGTWTPSYTGAGSDPTVGYSQQVGSYVKVGKFVFASFSLNTSSVSGGSSSSDLRVSGLPFTAGSGTGDRGGLSTVRTQNWVSNARSPVAGYINQGTSYINLSSYDAGAYSTATLCDTDDLRTTGDSNQLTATVTYISA